MMQFIVNNRTDALKPDINLFFTITNCGISPSRSLTRRMNFKFMCLSAYWQWKLNNERAWTFAVIVRDIREVKHDVYGKRQTSKMKLLPSLLCCVYSKVKLFVFVMNSKRRYFIFACFHYTDAVFHYTDLSAGNNIYIFAVCRLPLTSCLTSLIFNQHRHYLCFLMALVFYCKDVSEKVTIQRHPAIFSVFFATKRTQIR